MKRAAVLLVFVGIGVASGIGIVAAVDGPMADAGLDQTVGVNTTVYLDATGSTYPDGEIERYEWEIERTAGGVVEPDCAGCPRTQFTPLVPGRYEATVTVVGSDGDRTSDTLYVYVEDAGPSVEVSGSFVFS